MSLSLQRLKSTLLKDSLIYVAGEMTAKAVPFLLLPYLTRQLGTAGFGALSYYLSITAFLLIFMSLSQNGALTRYYYVYGKHGMGNILLAGGLYGVVVFVLAAFISLQLADEALFYCCLTAFFQSLLQNQLALRQCQKRAFSYLAIQLSAALTNLLLTVAIFNLFTGDKVTERLIAIVLSYFITFMGAMVAAQQQFALRFCWSWQRLRLGLLYIMTLGLPLLLHGISYTVKGQLDRVLIFQNFSAHELGIYSAGVQVASVVTVVIMAINSASVPHLYEKLKSKKITLDNIHRLFWLSFLLPLMATAIVWGLPQGLYRWALGADFLSSRYYVVCFVLGFSLLIPYLLLVNFLFYHGKNRQIATSSVLSTLVYLLLLLLLSPLGLKYVPFASIISNLAILPLLYYATLQVNKVNKVNKANKVSTP